MDRVPYRPPSVPQPAPAGPPLTAAAASALRRPDAGALPAAELALRLWAAAPGSFEQLLAAARAAEQPPAPNPLRSPWTRFPAASEGPGSGGGVHPSSDSCGGSTLSAAAASLAAQLQLLAGGVGSGVAALDAACCVLLAASAGHRSPGDTTVVGGGIAAALQPAARVEPPAAARRGEIATWRTALSALRILRQLLLHDRACQAATVESCMGAARARGLAARSGGADTGGEAGSGTADSGRAGRCSAAARGCTTAAGAGGGQGGAPAALLSLRCMSPSSFSRLRLWSASSFYAQDS